MVGHGERLLEAFGLVVYAARADGVHIAPVGLCLRVHRGIAVHLRGRGNQNPRLLGQGQAQTIVGAQGTYFQRLDGNLQVVYGRRRRCKVKDVVQRTVQVDVRADVVVHKGEFRQALEVLQVAQIASNQIVHSHHFVAFRDEAVAQVGTQESGGAGDEDAGHAVAGVS